MTKASPASPFDPSTATRETLSESWKAMQFRYDWTSAPEIGNYQNRLVSGKDLCDGGHRAIYAADKFIRPMADRQGTLKSGLSMISIGCGEGHNEASLIRQFGWPVSRFVRSRLRC